MQVAKREKRRETDSGLPGKGRDSEMKARQRHGRQLRRVDWRVGEIEDDGARRLGRLDVRRRMRKVRGSRYGAHREKVRRRCKNMGKERETRNGKETGELTLFAVAVIVPVRDLVVEPDGHVFELLALLLLVLWRRELDITEDLLELRQSPPK